jgi:hypothetical protein
MRRDAFKWAADEMAAEQGQDPTSPDNEAQAEQSAQSAKLNDQMKLEAFEQKQRHNEELHAAKLEAERIKLDTAQAQAARKLEPAPPMDINALRDISARQQMQYRGNLIPKPPQPNPLAKQGALEDYSNYPEPEATDAARSYGNPLTAMGIGGGVGALGAHTLAPTEKTRHYRKAIEELAPHMEAAQKVRAEGKIPANLIIEDAGKRYHLPADEAARLLRTMAHSSNAKRLAAGGAAGAGAGLLAHLLLNRDPQ